MAGVVVTAFFFVEGGLFVASPSQKALFNRCAVAVRLAEPDRLTDSTNHAVPCRSAVRPFRSPVIGQR
jgi:hypothetical protein